MFTHEHVAGDARPGVLGRILGSRLVGALASPQPVDRWVALVAPVWRVAEVRARVTAVRRETADAATFALRPNACWRGHRAGQWVQLAVEIDGVRRTRCYSVSSAEDAPGIEITVQRRADGLVSRFLHDRLRPGDVVTLSQAAGEFTLPPSLPEHLVFVTGGSGITPVMAMLRTLAARGHRGRIDLLHFARRRADVIFRDALPTLAASLPALRATLSLTAEPPGPGERAGRFDARHVPGLASGGAPDAWVCGPPALVADVERTWTGRGARDRLRVERFVPPPPPAARADGGRLTFARSARTVASDGRTLLLQAEAAGLHPASGCRLGICRTCVCTKRHGTVRDVVTGACSTATDEPIRLCTSVPVGDVIVEI